VETIVAISSPIIGWMVAIYKIAPTPPVKPIAASAANIAATRSRFGKLEPKKEVKIGTKIEVKT
jgi:hypothetical protein